jgi:hypothetical protein
MGLNCSKLSEKIERCRVVILPRWEYKINKFFSDKCYDHRSPTPSRQLDEDVIVIDVINLNINNTSELNNYIENDLTLGCMEKTPYNFPRITPKTPYNFPRITPKTPSNSPRITPKTPSNSPRITSKTPSNSPRIKTKPPSNSPRITTKTPSNSPRITTKTPSNLPKEISEYKIESVLFQPVEKDSDEEFIHISISDVVDTYESN